MTLTNEQKDKLFEAWAYCDDEDRSTEYMLEYMADTSGVEYGDVVNFVVNTTDEQRIEWYNKKQTNP